jgi:hypothetical protein
MEFDQGRAGDKRSETGGIAPELLAASPSGVRKEVIMVGECRWIAIHDHMPGTDPQRTLRVYGSCICPTPGYVLTLRYQEPQGTNPKDLLLNLHSAPPTGPVPDVLWPCTVEYEQTTEMEYETVTILGDGGGTVKVEHPV